MAVVATVLAPVASASSTVIIDGESTLTDPSTVSVGHPAAFTGFCPFVGLGHNLPWAGCMKQYEFTVPEQRASASNGGNQVEIRVNYETTTCIRENPCVKDNDLDPFLFDADGNVIDEDAGCDNGRLVVGALDLPAGDYVVEVRGNWGAVVEYEPHGTLTLFD